MSVQRNTLASAWYCLVHANVSVIAHTASIWITVTLSAFRYSMVRRAADGRAATATSSENDLRKSRYIVLLVCASCAVLLIPNYKMLAIGMFTDPATNQTMYYVVTTSSQPNSTAVDAALSTVNYWIHALIIKLVPCVLMSLFGFLLVLTVRRQRQRSRQLLRGTGAKSSVLTTVKCQSKSKAREGNHTTAMLVSVIVLFLITEFPQGVLALVRISHIKLSFSFSSLQFLGSSIVCLLFFLIFTLYWYPSVVSRRPCNCKRTETYLLSHALRTSRRRHGHCGFGQQRRQLCPLLRDESSVQTNLHRSIYDQVQTSS